MEGPVTVIKMGISDDIKPQKNKTEDIKSETDEITEDHSESDLVQEAVEIPIDKSGKTPPVYEDIFPEQDTSLVHNVDKYTEQDENKETNFDNDKALDEQKKPDNRSHWLRNILIFVVVFALVAMAIVNYDKIRSFIMNDQTPKGNSSEDDTGVEIISGQDYTRVSDDANHNNTSDTAETEVNDSNGDSAVTNDTDNTTDNSASQSAQPDKSSIKLKVLNGNGISGSAATLADVLKTNGFIVDSVTNASRFTYQNTTIYYNTGKSAESELVKQTLANYSVLTYENPTVAGNYDIIVVVGKN